MVFELGVTVIGTGGKVDYPVVTVLSHLVIMFGVGEKVGYPLVTVV